MSSTVVFVPEEEEEARIPLLLPQQQPNTISRNVEEEIVVADVASSSLSSTSHELDRSKAISSSSSSLNQRLVSLDVFRGLTVALMILVDDAGGAFPSINHSPWFGVTLADFVMPFFLFSVGVSVGLVFKKTSNKTTAMMKVISRTIKLFFLGLLLQGGYFHGRNHLTYGIDVDQIRWLGVLQRISVGYFLSAFSEIWFVGNVVMDSAVAFVKKYYVQWIVAILLCSLYMGFLYGIYVPHWKFEVPDMTFTLSTPDNGSGIQIVNCGMRSSLEPPCNAVGFIDRVLLGEKHLYQRPVYRRTKECSINSPDYGPLPPNAPGWCLAPFDPEGILSSLMAATTCFVGLHYGHIIVHYKGHTQRLFLWFISSMLLLLSGLILEVLGMPVSKPLYTLSYMCITAGAAGLVLSTIYYIVDVKHTRKPTMLLQWMGMNALIVYALAACELFPAAIQGFYWRSPSNNLVNGTELLFQTVVHSKSWGTLVFVLFEILFWCLAAGYLHKKVKFPNTMASDISNVETSLMVEKSTNAESMPQSHVGRSVAQRALYGSNRRRIGNRKGTNNDKRSLPSRLSKVSLADNATN
ncbi:Heparan-alpha-glucosaminide n-acetyltransferase [Thalictrum thalictroides]|uniref:Heparan-alpha-glucosaminide n-acetyltransferase n=1 Tax=Thalictrum thalictroides TaxID=46969 RepID=A0A7J6WM75_THATH|nr:Heparan-alpha-glucosaminide n-acetyltransferase [Thalictrum thalictroides]